MYKKSKDRYLNTDPVLQVDSIMLTLNAEKHLEETLDAWYCVAPIHWLYVIDGDSNDNTIEILRHYPRMTIKIKNGMTTGKAFELLKNMVKTDWFLCVDVGKIPDVGWYDEMAQHTSEGEFLASTRTCYKDEKIWIDPTIQDSSKRPLGGPWFIQTNYLENYHVDDDYAQRNIDIIIKKAVEEAGGSYHLVASTSHTCYSPTEITNKDELQRRHEQNAKGIVKYITPEYAKTNATYLLNDHWMLMMNNLSRDWIRKTNPSWIPVLKKWCRRRVIIAKAERFVYHKVLRK